MECVVDTISITTHVGEAPPSLYCRRQGWSIPSLRNGVRIDVHPSLFLSFVFRFGSVSIIIITIIIDSVLMRRRTMILSVLAFRYYVTFCMQAAGIIVQLKCMSVCDDR